MVEQLQSITPSPASIFLFLENRGGNAAMRQYYEETQNILSCSRKHTDCNNMLTPSITVN